MVVMLYVRFPLSLRNVGDLLFERGVDLCNETVRLWWTSLTPCSNFRHHLSQSQAPIVHLEQDGLKRFSQRCELVDYSRRCFRICGSSDQATTFEAFEAMSEGMGADPR